MEDVKKINESLKKIKNDILTALSSAGYITGIILIIIGTVLFLTELYTFYKINQIDNWPVYKNAGKIVETYIESKSEVDGYGGLILYNYNRILLYRTRIAFTYMIDNVEYISYKYSYYEPWYDDPTRTQYESHTLKPDTIVDVIINPNNRQEAYIANKKYALFDPIAIDFAIVLAGIYIAYKSKY